MQISHISYHEYRHVFLCVYCSQKFPLDFWNSCLTKWSWLKVYLLTFPGTFNCISWSSSLSYMSSRDLKTIRGMKDVSLSRSLLHYDHWLDKIILTQGLLTSLSFQPHLMVFIITVHRRDTFTKPLKLWKMCCFTSFIAASTMTTDFDQIILTSFTKQHRHTKVYVFNTLISCNIHLKVSLLVFTINAALTEIKQHIFHTSSKCF